MTYLSKRSEYKYFVVETGEDYTMVFTNEATYEDMVDGVLEPFFLNSEDNKRLNDYLGGILTKPAEMYGSKDGEEMIERVKKIEEMKGKRMNLSEIKKSVKYS